MVEEDFYEVLGVSRNATESEIRQARNALAQKYHPDVNKDKNAEETFKKINQAYGTLSDPQKRARYDQNIGNRQKKLEGEEKRQREEKQREEFVLRQREERQREERQREEFVFRQREERQREEREREDLDDFVLRQREKRQREDFVLRQREERQQKKRQREESKKIKGYMDALFALLLLVLYVIYDTVEAGGTLILVGGIIIVIIVLARFFILNLRKT